MGLLGGYVPGFPGAHSQGASMEELYRNLRGREISPTLLRKIARDIGMSVEKFVAAR
jgi:hypothetical protein